MYLLFDARQSFPFDLRQPGLRDSQDSDKFINGTKRPLTPMRNDAPDP
jgi:hypothetical protein